MSLKLLPAAPEARPRSGITCQMSPRALASWDSSIRAAVDGQTIKHGATHTLGGIGFKLRPHPCLEAIDGIKQTHHAVLDQVFDLDTGRQSGHQVIGDTLYERSEALYQLILVDLTSSVVHGMELSGVNGNRIDTLAQV